MFRCRDRFAGRQRCKRYDRQWLHSAAIASARRAFAFATQFGHQLAGPRDRVGQIKVRYNRTEFGVSQLSGRFGIPFVFSNHIDVPQMRYALTRALRS